MKLLKFIIFSMHPRVYHKINLVVIQRELIIAIFLCENLFVHEKGAHFPRKYSRYSEQVTLHVI